MRQPEESVTGMPGYAYAAVVWGGVAFTLLAAALLGLLTYLYASLAAFLSIALAGLFILRAFRGLRRAIGLAERQRNQLESSEASLRAQTDLLRSVFESIGEGVIVTGPGLALRQANAVAQQLLGIDAGPQALEQFAATARMSLHRGGPPLCLMESPFAKAAADQAVRDAEFVLSGPRFPGGLWISVTSTPLKDERTAAVTGAVTVVRDITGHKRAEEGRALVTALVEASHYAIITVDLEGRVLTWNKGAGATFGYPAEEVIEKPIGMLVPPERAGEAGEMVAKALRNGAPLEYETRRVRKDGSRIDVAISLAPIVGADGRPFALSAIVSDITERKRVQEQLFLARDAALESARVKSVFTANMSHELRTPLNGVIGALDMLCESPLSGEQAELARIANSSARALLAMVDGVLDFSRLSAGAPRARRIALDLRAVVTDTVNSFTVEAQRKGIKLTLRIGDAIPPQLYGDPEGLCEVLTNLTGNALKFTPAGVVEVEVTCEARGENSARLRFEVRDTGIGIPPEARSHVFEPFYTVDASSTREHGGMGLGLAISRALVGLMGGAIGVESEPGRGSKFYFTVEV